MRIRIRRTGGFAGISREAEVDTACLPGAARWESLASTALAQGSPEPPSGVPDGYRYAVTVDGRTVHFADPSVPEDVAELIASVLKSARPARPA
jgi:hypothetical protein